MKISKKIYSVERLRSKPHTVKVAETLDKKTYPVMFAARVSYTVTENKIIPIAETFDEKVNTWITILTVLLGAKRKDEYLQAWRQFQELVNTRDDWSAEKKINFIRVCEQDALNWHDEFRKSRLQKGYFE